MFNTLASYLFGGSNSKDSNINSDLIETSAEATQVDLQVVSTDNNFNNLNLTTISLDEEDDSDWLFVDRENKDSDADSLKSTDSEEDLLPIIDILKTPTLLRKNFLLRDDGKQLHAAICNLPTLFPSSLDDSWLVTPAPCFTSTGPIQIATSPLENLLIEHPSMSVYCSIRRGSSKNGEACDDLVVLEMSQGDIEDDVPEDLPNNETNVARIGQSHRMTYCQQQQNKSVMLVRQAQKNQVQNKMRPVNRNTLERTNKTVKVNGRNYRQKRADMQLATKSSRANNNRKC